jgi:hypothetical protein
VELDASQSRVSHSGTAFQDLEAPRRPGVRGGVRHGFVIRILNHLASLPTPVGLAILCLIEGVCALSAAGKGRQNLNLYGLAELSIEILLVGRPSIDQQ